MQENCMEKNRYASFFDRKTPGNAREFFLWNGIIVMLSFFVEPIDGYAGI